MPTPARVLAYCRVSSLAQADGSSLGDQQRALEAYAASKGTKLSRVFVEAESATYEKAERRVEVQALLKDVRRGDLVIVDKLDRWSRSPLFTYQSVQEIQEKGAAIYFVADDLDPTTEAGLTALDSQVAYARKEHAKIKVRLVGTRKLLRDQGEYVEGLAPWGYRRAAKGTARATRNVLIIEPTEATQVKEAFRLCADGMPVAKIAETLGVRRDRVGRALHRRIYLGKVQDAKGEWIAGKHESIIDARTFETAQAALASRTKGSRSDRDKKAETADWTLRDVARCACGAKLSAAYGGDPGPNRRHYYRCSQRCGVALIEVHGTEEACASLVWDRLVALRDELGKPLAPVKPAVDVRERRAKLDAKRARYLEQNADGITSRAELAAQLAKVDAERMRLDALAFVPEPPSKERRLEARDVAGAALRLWLRAKDGRVRRAIVKRLATSIKLTVHDNGDVDSVPEWIDSSSVDYAAIAELLLKSS
jgi:DNA invertase Pin-like site-specific DNA recombinase